MTDEQRSGRLGRNEALFREVNERVRELNEGFAQITKTFEIVCECSETTCVERLLLTPAEYEHVRERAEAFIVLREHVARGVERVSEDHGHYVVVEKLAEAAEVARETNPRN
jgi:hypothetical protein